MSSDDFDYIGEMPTVTNGHGGARKGAGRKPSTYVKPQEVKDFEKGRARNESAKADLNELDFKIKSGQYVSRAAVKQAAATALQSMIQSLRSIRDALERDGVPVEICERVDATVNEILEETGKELEMMSNPT